MTFIAEKDPGLIPQILSVILDECVNGVTLADPDQYDMPIVYVNKAFEQMTGYAQEEIIGKNCRFLQGNEHDQEARYKITEAIKEKKVCVVTLRNFKKNGELFYNRLKITPLFDHHGKVIYFLGIQYDVSDKIKAEGEIKALNIRLEKQQ